MYVQIDVERKKKNNKQDEQTKWRTCDGKIFLNNVYVIFGVIFPQLNASRNPA